MITDPKIPRDPLSLVVLVYQGAIGRVGIFLLIEVLPNFETFL